MNTNEALHKYEKVLNDINRGYSNNQIKTKAYQVAGKKVHLNDQDIDQLRDVNTAYKRQLKRNVLSGFSEANPGVLPSYSSSSSHHDDESEMNYQHKPADNMEALIQNAELKAELRFTKRILDEKEKELDSLKNQGLGSIEERTSIEFLKRDHAQLQEKYEALKKEYEKVLPELDELMESRKGFDMFKEILETASDNKEILMGMLATVNPQLGERMGLAGIEAGNNPETQKAVELGTMIIKGFQGQDFNRLRDLINILHAHKEMLPEADYLVKQRLQQKMDQAKKVGEDEMPEEFSNAQTI